MMKLRPAGVVLGLIGVLGLFSEVGWGLQPGSYRAGRFQYFNDSRYFSTKENYDDNGTVVALPNSNNQFLHTEIFNQLRYDLSFQSSLFLDVGVGNSKSVTPQDTRQRWSATDVGFGFETRIVSGWLNVVPDLRILFPLNRVDINGDEVMTGEGALQGQVGVYLSRNTRNFQFYGYAGSISRDEGRSWLLPWLVHSTVFLGPIGLGAEVGGFMTTLQDESTSNPSLRAAAVTKVNAGSQRFYSVNPSLVEARGLLTIRLGSQTRLALGYGSTLGGRRTAKGDEINFRYEMGFGGGTPPANATDVIEALEEETASFGAQQTGVGSPMQNATPNSEEGPTPPTASPPVSPEVTQELEDASVQDPATFKPDRPAEDPAFQPRKKEPPAKNKKTLKSEAKSIEPEPQTKTQSSSGKPAKKSKFKRSRERGKSSP